MKHLDTTPAQIEKDFISLEEDRYNDIVYPVRILKLSNEVRYKKAMRHARVIREDERRINERKRKNTPEYKRKAREYNQRPEVIARVKELRATPEAIAKRKAITSNPEYRKRRREYARKRYADPEIRKKLLKTQREYYKKYYSDPVKKEERRLRTILRKTSPEAKERSRYLARERYKRPEVKAKIKARYLKNKELKRLSELKANQ